MSKPVTPLTAPVPTRRQLDELEALLQRMLELPVRHEQEGALAASEPIESAEQASRSFKLTPHEWEESTGEVTDEGDREEPPQQIPVTAEHEWGSRIDSPRFLDELRPGTSPSWDDAAAQDAGEQLSSGPEANRDTIVAHPIIETPVDRPSLDFLEPEPGIFRILLGWAGLVCLIISLSILLLDWYGWTW
jgi:hypothetical protein